MKTIIKKNEELKGDENVIFFQSKNTSAFNLFLNEEELKYVKKEIKNKSEIIKLYNYKRLAFVINPKEEKDKNQQKENLRLIGDK